MNLPDARPLIPAMTPYEIARIRELERLNLARTQAEIATRHLIHAGLYARSIMIPAGVLLTGALIKRATVLVLHGDADLTIGDGVRHFTGYHVIAASAMRKQAILAYADTDLTMLFPTTAIRVADAEEEFTDEAGLLFSRHGENVVTITGESP